MTQVNDQTYEVSNTSESISEAPPSLARILFKGSSALGLATLLERGLGFLANLAAARLGGTHIFGAYSLAISTANNVASYAGAGIGTTANRFSGEYPFGGPGYRGFLRTLASVSLASAALAAAILWLAAKPIAVYLVRNPGLTQLLRLAALSAGAIILLECLRGLLIGQRRFAALLTLSALFGGGLILVLPIAARQGPNGMVIGQATVAMSAIVICILAAKALRFAPPPSLGAEVEGPRPAKIVRFGAVQLAGTIGLNAAGWWIASMVARADASLEQAAWYAVAMQLRNICAMPPWLISQTAYAQLTEDGGRNFGGAARVTVLSTLVATAVSLMICGPAAALMPWIVPHLFGKAFAGAAFAATLAAATGLIHMSAAPAAARLTVVSLPLTGIINGAWTVLLIALGTWMVPKGGAAAGAAAGFLVAHLFAAAAVLVALVHFNSGTRQLVFCTIPAFIGSLSLGILAWLRVSDDAHKTALSLGMLAVTAVLLCIAFQQARNLSPALRELRLSQLTSDWLARGACLARRA